MKIAAPTPKPMTEDERFEVLFKKFTAALGRGGSSNDNQEARKP